MSITNATEPKRITEEDAWDAIQEDGLRDGMDPEEGEVLVAIYRWLRSREREIGEGLWGANEYTANLARDMMGAALLLALSTVIE